MIWSFDRFVIHLLYLQMNKLSRWSPLYSKSWCKALGNDATMSPLQLLKSWELGMGADEWALSINWSTKQLSITGFHQFPWMNFIARSEPRSTTEWLFEAYRIRNHQHYELEVQGTHSIESFIMIFRISICSLFRSTARLANDGSIDECWAMNGLFMWNNFRFGFRVWKVKNKIIYQPKMISSSPHSLSLSIYPSFTVHTFGRWKFLNVIIIWWFWIWIREGTHQAAR